MNESQLSALLDRGELLIKNFNQVGNFVAKDTQKISRAASIFKVLTIFLGAFVATREVANQLIGSTNSINVVLYAAIGLLIAVIAGLDAAFKWESRAADLRVVASSCLTYSQQINTQMIKVNELIDEVKNEQAPASQAEQLRVEKDRSEKLNAIEKLLDAMEINLGQIHQRTASLGLNLAFEITKDHQVEIVRSGKPL